jgi:hypothetical protein
MKRSRTECERLLARVMQLVRHAYRERCPERKQQLLAEALMMRGMAHLRPRRGPRRKPDREQAMLRMAALLAAGVLEYTAAKRVIAEGLWLTRSARGHEHVVTVFRKWQARRADTDS